MAKDGRWSTRPEHFEVSQIPDTFHRDSLQGKGSQTEFDIGKERKGKGEAQKEDGMRYSGRHVHRMSQGQRTQW